MSSEKKPIPKRPGRFGEEEDGSLSAHKPCAVAKLPAGESLLIGPPKTSSWDGGYDTGTWATSEETRNLPGYYYDEADPDGDKKPPARPSVNGRGPPRVTDTAAATPDDHVTLRQAHAAAAKRPAASSDEEVGSNNPVLREKQSQAGTVPSLSDASNSNPKHAAAMSRKSAGYDSTPGARWMRGSSRAPDADEYRSVVSLEHSAVNSVGFESRGTNESVSYDFVETPHIVTATKVEEEPASEHWEAPMMEAPVQEIPEAEAVPEAQLRRKRRIVFAIFAILALAAIVGVAVGLSTKDSDTASVPEGQPASSPTLPPIPTLEKLMQENVLRCGVSDRLGFSFLNETSGTREGFEVDLCRAVAAAVFGDADRVEPVVTTTAVKFPYLLDGTIDLQARTTTHTMERDVFEKTTGADYAFSVPYLYDGLRFGGLPFFVACASDFSTTGACAGTAVCVNEGTTDYDILSNLLPRQSIVVLTTDTYGEALSEGLCNVVSGEQVKIAEVTIRALGYTGDYVVGDSVFSKEPLAMLTRGNDYQFTDFVNWVFQSLLIAEARGITQDSSSMMGTTDVFGAEFESMFINAVGAVGNYGEMYARHLESVVPRQGLNLINAGTALIYSHPFGALETMGPSPFEGGTLASILLRGKLMCGIAGAAELFDFGRDYCRALSAGILGPDGNVEFVDLTGMEGHFQALADGDVDALSIAPLSLASDVLEPTSGQGFAFSQPFFYSSDGEAHALATRQDDHQWSAFTYWIVTATFYAEEQGITQNTSNDMPLVNLFGPDHSRMFRDAILAVGNYGEIFERSLIPRSGRNLLNINPVGPQFYTPSGL